MTSLTNLGNEMAKNIPKTILTKYFLEDESIAPSIFLHSVTFDEIPAKLIKIIHQYVVKPSVHIIHLCFKTGNIPYQWKESIRT